jgi:hypothetical protein
VPSAARSVENQLVRRQLGEIGNASSTLIGEPKTVDIALILGCLALILIAALALGFLFPWRRSRSLERRAREAGFRFVHSARPFEGTNVNGFTLLEDGSATVVEKLPERTMSIVASADYCDYFLYCCNQRLRACSAT